MGLVVHRTAEVDLPCAILRHVAGLHQHHATGVVGGVFRGGRLDNHEVIELGGGQEVKRESAGVRLRTGDGGTVNPNLIVALGQPSHHNELVVDERDTRHAANDLGGIAVLCALNLLAADTRLDAEGGLGGPEDTHIGDDEGVGRLDGEREESVEVGGGAGGGAGDEDGGTDERFAGVGVEDKTDERLCCERMGNKKEKG